MKFLAVGLFWIAAFLVQKFNWGAGGEKAVVLLLLLLALPFLLRAAQRPALGPPAKLAKWVTLLVGVLIALQLGYFAKETLHPNLIDIATTTLAAGKAMLAGQNPYTLPLDTVAAANPADAAMAGYKYLPLMPVVYLPLGATFGARGLLATNLLLQLGVVIAVAQIARRGAGAAAALSAAALYLAVPLVAQQVLAKGATDLAAVLPLLVALLLVERNAFFAGLCAGLSIAMKPLPGVLFLPCLLPVTLDGRWRYAAGVALGCVPILIFALWSPQALYDNVVLFNALRTPDGTSWLALAPIGAATVARAVFGLLFIAVAAYVWRRAPTPTIRAGLGAMLVLAALLSSPAAHHNYQLWWLPFYCLVLARALMSKSSEGLPPGGAAR